MATQFDTIREATILARKHRKDIANGDLAPFIPAFAFALAKDSLIDVLTATILAAVVTEFMGLFISVYLFIFLWGKGKWKVRLIIFILGCFDSIPAVSLIPFSTVCVAYAYWQAIKGADLAKLELARLTTLAKVQLVRQHQMVQVVQAQTAIQENEVSQEGSKYPTAQGGRLSRGMDYVPVVGSAKMIGEAMRGRRAGASERMSGTERVRQGVEGAAFLAADMTGVGEVARLGKAGMAASKMGEHALAKGAGRQMMREGMALHERGKVRASNDARYKKVA